MRKERSIPIRSHGNHISERNKHLKRAGIATIGAIATGVVNPWVGAAISVAAIGELAVAIDHQEERKKGR